MVSNLVSIVLVNYNGADDTEKCLKSLERLENSNYRIIIVDNCSTDNSINILQRYVNDSVILIKSDENKGFSHGNNLGIRCAMELGTDYILLLNNDTEVETNFLSELLEPFNSREGVGITTCKMMYFSDKKRIWFGGGNMNWKRFRGDHENYKKLDNFYDYVREITFATGCCMLIKSEVIERVGELPEEYFMYFEDVDYCLKVQSEGYKIIYNPNSIIYHKVSSSSGGEESEFYIKWSTRNRLILMNKYKKSVSKIKFYKSKAFVYLSRIIKLIIYILKGEFSKAKAIISGLKSGIEYINKMV